MAVRSRQSRRSRRWTAAINAMNGVLVVTALVAVIELGAPVANNLGLSVGPTSTAGEAAGSQVLQNAAFPSWAQPEVSFAQADSPGSFVAVPGTDAALAAHVTSGPTVHATTPTPLTHPAVTAAPNVASTPAQASNVTAAIVSSPAPGPGAADVATSDHAHGAPAGSGWPHGNGQQHGGGPPGQVAEAAGAEQPPSSGNGHSSRAH